MTQEQLLEHVQKYHDSVMQYLAIALGIGFVLGLFCAWAMLRVS
jgi:hypothetical protein